MAKAKKLPSGNWNVTVFSHIENGKRRYVSFTAPTKAEASRLAAEFQCNKKEIKQDNLTVEKIIEKYIKSKENVLSPVSIYNYKLTFSRLGPIRNVRISNLTTEVMQNYVNDLSQKYNPSSVKTYYSLIRSAIIEYSDKRFRITFPKKIPKKRNIPTDEDIKLLIDNSDEDLKKAIILSAFGTLRRGEVCGLTYQDIDYDNCSIYVHSTIIYGVNGGARRAVPKTLASVRNIPMSKTLIDLLGHGSPDERIVKIAPASLGRKFKKLCLKLNMPYHFHTLRMYAASSMHAMNIPDIYIMERGGWSSTNILKAVYENVIDDKNKEFTGKALDYYQKIIEKEDQ